MNVGGWALRHRSLVLLTLVALIAAGLAAMGSLASGIYPEVEFPRIAVVVRQGDAPPEVFQTTVTRTIEQELMTVFGVERVRSRTIRGGAELQMLFGPGADMWRALQLVQASMADIRPLLPPDTRIRIERLTPVSFPILTLNVSGPLDSRDLHDLAEFTLRPAIARVPGVGAVGVLGGDVREVQVEVDAERAAAAHLRLTTLATTLQRSFPLLAVGRVEQDHALATVIATAEATDIDDIASVPVALDASGVPIRLGDLATVREGEEDRTFRTSGPRGDTVAMTIARLEGASTSVVVQDVLGTLDRVRPSLPQGVVVEPVYDQGQLVGASIASVRDAILVGIVLCLLVIGAFLRDLRAGFVAGLAAPVTLAITFAGMALLGETLNLMSLGGMAVAIGLVVDDAIVIVEAIARRIEQGESPTVAAERGTRELSAAVIGTTVTTVIVFLPLTFLQGVVGRFFQSLATTLSVAVVLSLAVALFVVPIAAAAVMRARPTAERVPSARLEAWVRWSARRPWVGIGGTLLATAFAALVSAHVPTGFMPSCDEGAFVLDYFTPAGTSLTDTDAIAQRIEQILRETPEVATFSRRTGAQLNPTAVTLWNKGDFVVRLSEPPRRHADDVIASVRERVEREVPGVRAEFVQVLQDMLNDLSGTPHPIEVKVFGEDQATLEPVAARIAERIAAIPGAVDVFDGVEQTSTQIVAHLDRDAAIRLGLHPDEVADELHAGMLGAPAGVVRRFDRFVGIRVRYPDALRNDTSRLTSLPLPITPAGAITGTLATMADVAYVATEASPTELLHEGLQPVVIVTADHEGRDLGSVVRDVESALVDVALPPGVRVELSGQIEGQREASSHLVRVALGGSLLVLVALVAQFGSISPALAVLITAPLGLVGALSALWFTDIPLNASSLMGCVLLVGLVVKNGILLIEVAEEHAAESDVAYEDALVFAADRRLRPIVMTTLATLAGLTPLALALGAGAELQQPLAVAVIGGLTVSALLSLGILPSLAATFHHHLSGGASALQD